MTYVNVSPWNDTGLKEAVMGRDIVERLKVWREDLIKNEPDHVSEKSQIEIDMLKEAIEEIQRLRENQR
jgi:hypothetical protein